MSTVFLNLVYTRLHVGKNWNYRAEVAATVGTLGSTLLCYVQVVPKLLTALKARDY